MEEKILEIIIEATGEEGLRTNKDIDLLENEIFDSLGFINLIEMLEEEFDIEIQPTQERPDTWRSVDSIVSLVKRYANGK